MPGLPDPAVAGAPRDAAVPPELHVGIDAQRSACPGPSPDVRALSPAGAVSVVSGICHGTLGELIQGPFVRDGAAHISLISLPIKQYSFVHFTHGEDGDIEIELRGKDKCRRAIEIYLARHRKLLPSGKWSIDSELTPGKGMASSTADIVATIRCLDRVFSMHSSTAAIAEILREVERSDSVYLDTYVLYLSGRQEVVECFDGDPKFYACYIDEGDGIDTEKVGAPLLAHYERRLPAYQANLDLAVNAFLKQDWGALARCATTSAILAQDAIPKCNLDVLLSQQASFRADGIVVAHTGSLLGYLFNRKPSSAEMGELSSFFRGLGHQCRFVQTGF